VRASHESYENPGSQNGAKEKQRHWEARGKQMLVSLSNIHAITSMSSSIGTLGVWVLICPAFCTLT